MSDRHLFTCACSRGKQPVKEEVGSGEKAFGCISQSLILTSQLSTELCYDRRLRLVEMGPGLLLWNDKPHGLALISMDQVFNVRLSLLRLRSGIYLRGHLAVCGRCHRGQGLRDNAITESGNTHDFLLALVRWDAVLLVRIDFFGFGAIFNAELSLFPVFSDSYNGRLAKRLRLNLMQPKDKCRNGYADRKDKGIEVCLYVYDVFFSSLSLV